ncbi:hypothetical protein [Parasedimentitalea huanghaiensis]|uniref:Uncharacterized protein n=1 Tax=Parasedimentitalea huanghaiensis TaxID=2682100 RepID=A0A6L6WGG0_9RHOB|nr:hypothetical protein [Zongyanglinia huanghaiensis]MVO16866.1 hypothetical protein [Zongyanglinia huanghaiensis]
MSSSFSIEGSESCQFEEKTSGKFLPIGAVIREHDLKNGRTCGAFKKHLAILLATYLDECDRSSFVSFWNGSGVEFTDLHFGYRRGEVFPEYVQHDPYWGKVSYPEWTVDSFTTFHDISAHIGTNGPDDGHDFSVENDRKNIGSIQISFPEGPVLSKDYRVWANASRTDFVLSAAQTYKDDGLSYVSLPEGLGRKLWETNVVLSRDYFSGAPNALIVPVAEARTDILAADFHWVQSRRFRISVSLSDMPLDLFKDFYSSISSDLKVPDDPIVKYAGLLGQFSSSPRRDRLMKSFGFSPGDLPLEIREVVYPK